MQIYRGTQDLSAGALSFDTDITALGRTINNAVLAVAPVRRLQLVTLHAPGVITETVEVLFVSARATNPTVLASSDLVAAQDFAFTPQHPLVLGAGDNIRLTCTNANTPAVTVEGEIHTMDG